MAAPEPDPRAAPRAPSIRVSLVVPVQDEEDTIDDLLASIAEQKRIPEEVVLVDAGSRDRTRERVLASKVLGSRLRVVVAPRVFPGLARNLGVASAAHDWIAFTDAGIRLDAAWLEALLNALGDPPAEVVFGSYRPVCDTFFRRCAALAYVPPVGAGGIRGPFVASMLLRRALFERVGGFPPYRAAEDLVFVERIQKSSEVVRWAPGAIAVWSTAAGARATFRRFSLYSFHNLVAGRGRYWHQRVGQLYLALSLAIVAGVAVGLGSVMPWLLPAFLLARVSKATWRGRASLPFAPLRVQHLVGAAGLLAVIDLATLTGALLWLARGRPRLTGAAPVVDAARRAE